jgi:hypothetical protein
LDLVNLVVLCSFVGGEEAGRGWCGDKQVRPVVDVDGVFVEGDGEDFAGVVAADLDALAGDHDAAAAGDDPAGERRFLAEARRRTRSLAVRL